MKYIFLIIRTVFVFSLVLFFATYYYNGQLVALDRDISDAAMSEPIQTAITDNYGIEFEKGDYLYKVKPIANYLINGIVLKRTHYDFLNKEPDSAIQYDVCLAWGSNLKDGLYLSSKPEYTQFKRECYYSFSGGSNGFSSEKFSNNRLIINDAKILEVARSINAGDEISIKGRLSNITAYKKTDLNNPVLDWKTSESRTEDGKKATSEIIYVDSIDIVNPAHYKESIINYYAYWVSVVTAGLIALHIVALLIFMVPKKRSEF